MNETWENDKETSFGPDFNPFGPNSGRQIFFSKTWLCQSLDIMVSYHHVQYQIKKMIQSWENLVTDGQTDGRMDGWEWFHRTLSDWRWASKCVISEFSSVWKTASRHLPCYELYSRIDTLHEINEGHHLSGCT